MTHTLERPSDFTSTTPHHCRATATICLTMIVKNETRVIVRCLESVKPLIDYWIIVDTGSTDGTQALIRSVMADIPGELFERPWRDFGHNRTEGLELARGKARYLLVIDADDMLIIPPQFVMPTLTSDAYSLCIEYGNMRYWRKQLFRSDLDFYYQGVLHEALVSPQERTHEHLEQLRYLSSTEGARSGDTDKYHKDAAVLEGALVAEPANARYMFYLAQSWRDAGEHAKALIAYTHRVTMGGWEEEVYSALYEIANLSAQLGLEDAVVIERYLTAYERRPTRAEPLYRLAVTLRHRGRHRAAYPFAVAATGIEHPNDILFVDESVYAWRALDEYAVAASWVEKYQEAVIANQHLLQNKALPETERQRIQENSVFCEERIKSI